MNLFFFNFYQGQKTNKIVNVVSNSCGAGRAKWTTLDFGGVWETGENFKMQFYHQVEVENWKTWLLIFNPT